MAEKLKGPGLTQERFLALVAELRKADGAKDAAVGECRAIRKRMKSQGVDLDAYALMQTLAKLEPDDAAARMKNLRRYVAWDGSGIQLPLFAEELEEDEDAAPSSSVVDAIHDEAVAVAMEREASAAADSAPVGMPPAIRKASTRRAMTEPAVH